MKDGNNPISITGSFSSWRVGNKISHSFAPWSTAQCLDVAELVPH